MDSSRTEGFQHFERVEQFESAVRKFEEESGESVLFWTVETHDDPSTVFECKVTYVYLTKLLRKGLLHWIVQWRHKFSDDPSPKFVKELFLSGQGYKADPGNFSLNWFKHEWTRKK